MAQRPIRRAEAELEHSSTEQVLESARHLDRLSVEEMLGLIHREDGEAWKAVGEQLPRVAEAVELLAAAERYRDLLVASEEFPVIPAVEVWGFRKKTLKRLGQAVLVALEADHPRACVLPDVYHLYKGGSGLGGIPLLSGKILGGFHLNDYPADPPREKIADRHRVHCGDGVAPLEKFFRDLWSTGYRGALSIELFNPDYWKQDPLKVAKESLEKTRRVMERAFAG